MLSDNINFTGTVQETQRVKDTFCETIEEGLVKNRRGTNAKKMSLKRHLPASPFFILKRQYLYRRVILLNDSKGGKSCDERNDLFLYMHADACRRLVSSDRCVTTATDPHQ